MLKKKNLNSNVIYNKQTWVSLASDPLFVKKAFPIFDAVKVSRSSFARSC